MTVPILRDVELRRVLNDPQVAAGVQPVLSCWVGRAGEVANVTWSTLRLLPGGGTSSSQGGSVAADPIKTGHYTAPLPNLVAGGYYRLNVTATDPGVPADTVTQQFQFTHTG